MLNFTSHDHWIILGYVNNLDLQTGLKQSLNNCYGTGYFVSYRCFQIDLAYVLLIQAGYNVRDTGYIHEWICTW